MYLGCKIKLSNRERIELKPYHFSFSFFLFLLKTRPSPFLCPLQQVKYLHSPLQAFFKQGHFKNNSSSLHIKTKLIFSTKWICLPFLFSRHPVWREDGRNSDLNPLHPFWLPYWNFLRQSDHQFEGWFGHGAHCKSAELKQERPRFLEN